MTIHVCACVIVDGSPGGGAREIRQGRLADNSCCNRRVSFTHWQKDGAVMYAAPFWWAFSWTHIDAFRQRFSLFKGHCLVYLPLFVSGNRPWLVKNSLRYFHTVLSFSPTNNDATSITASIVFIFCLDMIERLREGNCEHFSVQRWETNYPVTKTLLGLLITKCVVIRTHSALVFNVA